MLIQMPTVSPIFAAYEAQKQQFDAALDQAIAEAAQKVGRQAVAEMFKLKATVEQRELKAA